MPKKPGEHVVVQASDTQDSGEAGNLKKLESILKATKLNEAPLHFVGDLCDMHLFPDAAGERHITALKQFFPEVDELLMEQKGYLMQLMQKYQDRFDPRNLAQEEADYLNWIGAQLKAKGFNDARDKDYKEMNEYCGKCADLLNQNQTQTYFIFGNNDPRNLRRLLRRDTVYPADRPVNDGLLNIIGANNTNIKREIAFVNPEMYYPNDTKGIDQKLAPDAIGGMAHCALIHGPPNGHREGKDDPELDDMTKLIKAHTPKTGYLLVECGHFHKAVLETVKNAEGTGGYVLARSSPDIFFEHYFDDNGKYLYTDVMRYT